jgi:N-acetylmuramoyl-L-alanine amidase
VGRTTSDEADPISAPTNAPGSPASEPTTESSPGAASGQHVAGRPAPEGSGGAAGLSASTLIAAEHPVRQGDHGPVVGVVRALLAKVAAMDPKPDRGVPATAEPDPDRFEPDRFDPNLFEAGLDRAVRAFQQDRGLLVDGIVGRQTALQLDGARWRLGDRTLLLTQGGHWMRGDDVSALQERMVVLGVHAGPVDGIFGPATDAALRELQRGLGLPADGICGRPTFEALGALGRSISGGDAWALRSHALVAMAGRSLAGKVITLDPAPDELTGLNGIDAREITFDVATRLAERLRTVGASVVVTRGPGDSPETSTRAELAETAGADLVISFFAETQPSAVPSGVATYYWGGGRVGQQSATGQRLAMLIQREIVARTDLVDDRSHPCTFDLVRITRMPVVMVSLGYLTNPGDAERLALPECRETLAEAVLFAVQRLYLGEDDAQTGTLNLHDVQAFSRGD